MRLASRTQFIAPFFAMESSKQANALIAQGKPIIKLNIGEPDFAVAPAVQSAMVAAIPEANAIAAQTSSSLSISV